MESHYNSTYVLFVKGAWQKSGSSEGAGRAQTIVPVDALCSILRMLGHKGAERRCLSGRSLRQGPYFRSGEPAKCGRAASAPPGHVLTVAGLPPMLPCVEISAASSE